MFSHKDLNCGFVILCHEHSINLLKSTTNSIKARYPGMSVICATDDTATEEDMKQMKLICPTYKGKKTFSSLINTGMRHAKTDWNFIICAGATVRSKLHDRFSYFIDSEKDILFPIADGKTDFVEATLNGLFINRSTWREVGEMEDEGDLETVKILWATSAMGKGVRFKAIAGCKMC